ncbi:hypothetical protein ACFB49_06320 [Sphingomonas sp. DBB INV C78]
MPERLIFGQIEREAVARKATPLGLAPGSNLARLTVPSYESVLLPLNRDSGVIGFAAIEFEDSSVDSSVEG